MTGLLFFGVVSLATAGATSLGQITILRFLTGVGLGGVIPNIVALISEFVPRRLRGRCLVIVTAGVAVGVGLCGRVASAFVPQHGWQILVIVGGAVPLVLMVLVYFFSARIDQIPGREGRSGQRSTASSSHPAARFETGHRYSSGGAKFDRSRVAWITETLVRERLVLGHAAAVDRAGHQSGREFLFPHVASHVVARRPVPPPSRPATSAPCFSRGGAGSAACA